MPSFRPSRRRVINFADPESQKGFVYLPGFLPVSSLAISISFPAMGLVVSSLRGLSENTFLFLPTSRVSPFRPSSSFSSSVAFPAYLCPSLDFQLRGVPIHRNNVWIQWISDTVGTVKIGRWPKTSIFRFLHREKRRPGRRAERYRQLLRDRINRANTKVAGMLLPARRRSDAEERMLCAAFQSHLSRRRGDIAHRSFPFQVHIAER